MPIRWDTRNKRFRYSFNRVIHGRRVRASRLLPASWDQAQADAYDRKEGARLYALASGIERVDPLIDEAVLLYLRDKQDLKSYRATMEHLAAIAWAYAAKPLSALPDVSRAVREEPPAPGRKPLSEGTKRNRLACLKAACRWAWKKHGVVENDPTVRMQLPSVRNERQIYVSRADMLGLCFVTPDRDVRRMIRTAFYTGMRLGELQRVQVRGAEVLHLVDTKNGDSRSIPVHPRVRCCLRYLPLQGEKRFYQHAFKRARELIGMPEVHIHDLRHSAASEMANAEVDLYTIGQVLGHRDSRSTKRYSHLTSGTLASAVNKIGRKIGQKDAHKPCATGTKKIA